MSSPRIKVGLYAAVVLAVFVLASYKLYRRSDARTPQKDAVLIQVMLQGLTAAHYHPEKLDDSFSRRVFDLYLKRVDANKKFLLATDVAQLRKFQTDIDDQVRRGTHEFMDQTNVLLDQRVKDVQALYRDILAKPFDFTTEETFETESDKVNHVADKNAQREEWRKFLKYHTMVRISEMMDAQAKKNAVKDKPAAMQTKTPGGPSPIEPAVASDPEPNRTPAEMEIEARKRVLKYFDEQFNDMQQNDANDRLAMYANTIANTYDPHTEYFAPRDKESFDIAMTGRFEGIGATLREKEGQITVEDIMPGSAS